MIAQLLEDFTSLFFPACCQGCREVLGKNEELICTECRTMLPVTDLHLEKGNRMEQKFYGKVPISSAFAYLNYSKKGRSQRLVHALKYHDQPEIGQLLGRWYGAMLAEAGWKDRFDLLAPVPLHPKRQKERGYNQAEEFAKGLSVGLDIPVEANLMFRKVATATQTKKGRFARWENVTDVFEVGNQALAAHKRILLTDDVVTTGATLEACAERLLAAGAASVSIAALAVA